MLQSGVTVPICSAEPGNVTDLRCPSDEDGNVLGIMWGPPMENPQTVNSYRVTLSAHISNSEFTPQGMPKNLGSADVGTDFMELSEWLAAQNNEFCDVFLSLQLRVPPTG